MQTENFFRNLRSKRMKQRTGDMSINRGQDRKAGDISCTHPKGMNTLLLKNHRRPFKSITAKCAPGQLYKGGRK